MTTQNNYLKSLLDSFSEALKCKGCNICESTRIYVLPSEAGRLKDIGVPLIEIEGLYFIEKKGNFCPMLDKNTWTCKIYKDRPLDCCLFPLLIVRDNGKIAWYRFKGCPPNFSVDLLRFYARKIELAMGKEILEQLAWADSVCERIELDVDPNVMYELLKPIVL